MCLGYPGLQLLAALGTCFHDQHLHSLFFVEFERLTASLELRVNLLS